MTNDLISRQAAIDALKKRDKHLRNINWYDKPYAEGECKGIGDALDIIDTLPSVQPENIKCKDCDHYGVRQGMRYCFEMYFLQDDPEFYCGYAERREDAQH